MICKMKIGLIFITIGLLIGISLLTNSCNKITPAGFWKNYHKDLQLKKISDQGPWGGYRIIHWESKDSCYFEINDILKYADKNGWTLIDSSEYGKNLPKSWTFADKPIFPYNYDKSNDLDNKINDKLQRWIDSEFKLFSFKTGWIIIKPGADESTERTGFILVSYDKRKMTVYHLWGE